MQTTSSMIPSIETTEKTDQIKKPFVSIVVPGYNEAAILKKNLQSICDYMESLKDEYQWELIFVNDGSTDETGEVAEAFAEGKDNIRVLHHMYNFRLGQALRFAFSKCRGDYIVTLDADLSYSPDHIGRLLDKIRETRAKIVIASPYLKGGKVSNVPWLRKMFSVWANRFLSLTVTKDHLAGRLTTITGMVRAYDRKFLSKLNLKAMGVDINPEILYKAMILRARIVEIPAHLKWSDSKAGSLNRKSSIRIVKTIISSLLSGFIFRPFMFFVLPGFALMLLSFYPITWIFIHTFSYYENLPPSSEPFHYRFSDAVALAFNQSPHAFIVGGFALLVAIQLISLGILALQNKRYFEEMFHLGTTVYKHTRKDH